MYLWFWLSGLIYVLKGASIFPFTWGKLPIIFPGWLIGLLPVLPCPLVNMLPVWLVKLDPPSPPKSPPLVWLLVVPPNPPKSPPLVGFVVVVENYTIIKFIYLSLNLSCKKYEKYIDFLL